jgi:CRP-like cAMP-binding protein
MEEYASVLNNESAKEKYLRLLNEHSEILQKASVEHIATYLGVTRRTLSRIRQETSIH